jgi:hypothetical protein
LLAKACLFAVTLAVLLLTADAFVASTTSWRRYENPRERILWDGQFDGTRTVLIGGSEFASFYVDSLADTLWARLEAYTGDRVFPGALNGARPLDVVAAAVHVSQEWARGTTVFVSLSPTRFVESGVEEAAKGNFSETFFRRYGIDAADSSRLRRLEGAFQARLLSPLSARRTRSALAHMIDHPGPPGWMRNRVWFEDPGGAPRERFELLERNLRLGTRPRSIVWVEQIRQQLEAAGMRPVFVVTPMNEPLVRRFSRVYPAQAILDHFRHTVDAVTSQLDGTGAAVIDLTNGTPTQCFFDLVHVNACGDDLMASRLAEWLQRHSGD